MGELLSVGMDVFFVKGRQHEQLITAGENSELEGVHRHVPSLGGGMALGMPSQGTPKPSILPVGPTQYKPSYGLALE